MGTIKVIGHDGPLMVVGEFDVVGVAVTPNEADAPLFIHANRILAGPVTPEGFQVVARRDARILKNHQGVQQRELAHRPLEDIRRHAFERFTVAYRSGSSITEALYHERRVQKNGTLGKGDLIFCRGSIWPARSRRA